tara:strand:- start:94 stop:420 length:327 start_codon:yes stop_codon:yes gene_type:complete
MNAKDLFEEFTKFAPQHTSIIFPATVGLVAFILVCSVGYLYNEKKLNKRYSSESPYRESEMMARNTMLMIVAIFTAFWVTDFTYSIVDYSKNKKWYVWKYHWFPQMLS